MTEIEDNTNKWKDIPCSWTGRINIIKMTLLPEAIYIFNIILIKILITVAFFIKIEQITLKFVQKHVCECLCGKLLKSCLTVTLWTVAWKAPLSMVFSRQEHWSGFPCLSPRELPDPGIEIASPVAPELQEDSLPLSHWGSSIQKHKNPKQPK